MLKKTAAIAVLILLVSSLFAGSVNIVPAQEQAGTNKGVHASALERLIPAAFPVARGMVSEAYASREPNAGFIPVGMASSAYVSNIPTNDVPVSGEPYAGYTMVILTNESRIEMSELPSETFAFKGNVMGAGAVFAGAGVKFGMAGARAVNITIHSPVIMFGPDGAARARYDMKWEGRHNMAGVAGVAEEIGFFAGHLEIPWNAVSGVTCGPPGLLFGASDVIELKGNMVVDMANLTAAGDSAADASPYGNQISGGQTNWHAATISSAVKSVNVDLKWHNVGDQLRLVIYTPDGKVLGPYDDSSDGTTDGRINLNIANPSGVAAGQWYLKVTDTSLTGKDEYYAKTY